MGKVAPDLLKFSLIELKYWENLKKEKNIDRNWCHDLYINSRCSRDAVIILGKYIEEFPDAPDILYNYAEVLHSEHEYKKALHYSQILVNKYPDIRILWSLYYDIISSIYFELASDTNDAEEKKKYFEKFWEFQAKADENISCYLNDD